MVEYTKAQAININHKYHMISQLTIQNFGLIDHLTAEFCKELNIFTGETGAGKSILIDALRFCLGERLNSAQIRDSDEPCIVEAVFELTRKQIDESPILLEYLDNESALIINRTYLSDGRNKNKINGFNVTVSQLKKIGDHLVDFHGPHDHQMLFAEDSHLNILDKLCRIEEIKAKYTQKYNEYLYLRKELEKLRALSESREREQDMLSYQIKELKEVPLDTARYQELTNERTRINNAEKLHESACQLINALENEHTGITRTLIQAFASMKTLNSTDETTVEFADILARIQEDSSELISLLNNYLNTISFDSDKANEINRCYDIYYDIMRKYGPTLEDAKKFYETAKERYDNLVNLEHNDAQLRNKIETAKETLKQIAQKISEKRKKTADALEKIIEKELKELGIARVRFECRIEETEINNKGQDKVVFYISPNLGEDLMPLAKIISSGEAARVMLALKKALTKVDPIPVLIFDEIDAQIGGRLGAITGKKLKELSQNRQVILITHLPQIASFGNCHFKVLKKVKNNRTTTTASLLDAEERIKELAKMMSGEKMSQIAVKHAHDMLAKANK